MVFSFGALTRRKPDAQRFVFNKKAEWLEVEAKEKSLSEATEKQLLQHRNRTESQINQTSKHQHSPPNFLIACTGLLACRLEHVLKLTLEGEAPTTGGIFNVYFTRWKSNILHYI